MKTQQFQCPRAAGGSQLYLGFRAVLQGTYLELAGETAGTGVGIAGTEVLSPVMVPLGQRTGSSVLLWPQPRLYRDLPATSGGWENEVGLWSDLEPSERSLSQPQVGLAGSRWLGLG